MTYTTITSEQASYHKYMQDRLVAEYAEMLHDATGTTVVDDDVREYSLRVADSVMEELCKSELDMLVLRTIVTLTEGTTFNMTWDNLTPRQRDQYEHHARSIAALIRYRALHSWYLPDQALARDSGTDIVPVRRELLEQLQAKNK